MTDVSSDEQLQAEVERLRKENAKLARRVSIGSRLRFPMVGGYSVITQDVLPFSTTVSPRETKVFGANATGLERRGYSSESIDALHKAFRLLTRSNLNTSQAVEKIREEVPRVPEIEELLTFIASSERGFIK